MVMDSLNGFEFGAQNVEPNSDQYRNLVNGINFSDALLDDFSFNDQPFPAPDPDPSNSSALWSTSPEGDSPSDDRDSSDMVLKYINQMLMEEDMGEKTCMFQDCLALQAAEKSLYEALGEKHHLSPTRSPFSIDSPDDSFSSTSSDYSSNSSPSNTSNLVKHQWFSDFGEEKPSLLQSPLPNNFVFRSASKPNSQSSSISSPSNIVCNGNGIMGTSLSKFLASNMFSESESALQFKRGVEEANKFLPSANKLIIDLENNSLAPKLKEKALKEIVKEETDEREYPLNVLRGKKNHERGDINLEEDRSSKQLAVCVDEVELSEMFDRILLCAPINGQPPPVQIVASKIVQQNRRSNNSNGGKLHGKKQGNKKAVVDLRTLLTLCAQAVSNYDRRTADELLWKIRQHSSPFGDGSQRVSHYFANSLEARLDGTGGQIYTSLDPKRTAADMLKAFQVYMSASPFKKCAIFFANRNITNVAEKATTLHIIDFGIRYGFQWPSLIHSLSNRPGGPPKLRITGIELPQPGFRPAERVLETGHRLAKYCKRFNVPFEYNAIAQKWETIKIEDLKINKNEVIAVNCLFRFANLLDETVVVNSPRNAVLNLVRKINPNIFVHAVGNGSYNAPFFVTRFREALFHFSALFDMLDTNLPREDHMRLMFEKEFYGREAMNVIACEGSERVERPETYKQWQVRNMRAGFRQLPLDEEIMKMLRCKVKAGYDNNFMVNEDGHWMLQGWKGRIIYASSAWIPACGGVTEEIENDSRLQIGGCYMVRQRLAYLCKYMVKQEAWTSS